MFTSGDVLFPEIFEITLGSEKGKYLVPQQGVVSGLNLGRRWKGKVEFLSNDLLNCRLDRVIFRQSDLYRSWKISQISLRGVVEKSFELKVVWKVVCNVDAVLCNGKKVWTLPREPAEQGSPCAISRMSIWCGCGANGKNLFPVKVLRYLSFKGFTKVQFVHRPSTSG